MRVRLCSHSSTWVLNLTIFSNCEINMNDRSQVVNMLHVLPTEVTLSVLSHLPIPSLPYLPVLSHQWPDFFTTNQSAIFHSAALLHEYIQPETLSLEDALSVNTGRPWVGSVSWKDFCRRSFQLRKNWEGKGRALARVLSPPSSNVHRIKVDEKVGICITTYTSGGISVIHLISSIVLWCLPRLYVRPFAHCECDNGYPVFDHMSEEKEVWRLASDFSAEGEVATHSPPDVEQMDASACAAAHVSRDGHDLVVLSHKRRVVFIRDFERICRGETSLERGWLSLSIRSKDVCYYLGFEHGRVCVVTMQGLYIFTFGPDLSAKAVFVQPSKNVSAGSHAISCMQLTDRHIYFTWGDARRRQDIPLFKDAENVRELPPPITPTLDQ
ncbi:hypothetical protein EDB87DRAFT_406313 [Lactarius vividus]|nr:hypothetical protein EDB87DRAFT_406313 [Lactarius vividus]